MNLVSISTSLASRMSDLIASRPDVVSDADPRVNGGGGGSPDAGPGFWWQHIDGFRTPTTRVREMKYYDYLEREIPDVRKALDAFATMAVTGNLAGGGVSTFKLRPKGDPAKYPQDLLDRLRTTEKLINAHAFLAVRGMCKYGSYLVAMEISRGQDKRLGVSNIKHVPPGTMFRNIDAKGQSDPNSYWVQMVDGKIIGASGDTVGADQAKAAGIPQWRVPHFALWSNVVNATETLIYGTSILQPFGAIGLKVHASLDSVVVARLSRAAMRYKYSIDVSDIKNDHSAIKRRMGFWQRALTRATSLLGAPTASDSFQRANVPDADFFIPAGQGLAWDLDKIDGDMNLSRVGDLEMLVRFYFGALGVPPEYLGHERSHGGRSNLSQIDINFARSSRHIQMFAAAGFEHIAICDMLLGGWNPIEYPIECVPPPIGARDDLLQAQIRQLQSAVMANLAAAGLDMTINPRWVLTTFMNLDDELETLKPEEIEALFQELNEPAPTTATEPSTESVQKIMAMLAANDGAMRSALRSNVRAVMEAMRAGNNMQNYRLGQPTTAELADALESMV